MDQAAYGWWQFCTFQGLESEARQTLGLAVESARQQLQRVDGEPARQQHQQMLSKLLAISANYLFAQGQNERMAAQAEEAIALGMASGSAVGETLGTFVLGRALQELGQRAASGAAWERTIQLAERYQNDSDEGELLCEAE